MPPYFYLYSIEIFTASGILKSKSWGTVTRSEKVDSQAAFESFDSLVRKAHNVSKSQQIHWISVCLLNP